MRTSVVQKSAARQFHGLRESMGLQSCRRFAPCSLCHRLMLGFTVDKRPSVVSLLFVLFLWTVDMLDFEDAFAMHLDLNFVLGLYRVEPCGREVDNTMWTFRRLPKPRASFENRCRKFFCLRIVFTVYIYLWHSHLSVQWRSSVGFLINFTESRWKPSRTIA